MLESLMGGQQSFKDSFAIPIGDQSSRFSYFEQALKPSE